MKVLAVPEVIEYLNNLVDILFEKYGKDMQYAVFKKTNIHHGIYFLRCTEKTEKKFTLFATLPITTLLRNIYK